MFDKFVILFAIFQSSLSRKDICFSEVIAGRAPRSGSSDKGGRTLNACKQLCINQPTCKSIIHRPSDNRCYTYTQNKYIGGLKSVGGYVYYGPKNNICVFATCNQNNKIQFGRKSDTESDCIDHGGCYDSVFGCYYSEENIPGFRMMKGECSSCSTKKTLTNLRRTECARECLKMDDCHCFIYDSISKECLIKNVFCHETSSKDGSKITYSRFASKNIACSDGNCIGNDILNKYANVEDCNRNCKNNSNCKLIVQQMNGNAAHTCYLKRNICDFTLPDNRFLHSISCLPGPIFPDWLTNHYNNRAEIEDDSNSTCRSVVLADNFNMKIPWPSVGQSTPDFKLSIIGKNLENCIDFSKKLPANGVIAFVVNKFNPTYEFLGNFKACKLIDKEENVKCVYQCSCGIDYCEAVHIRAFSSNERNMSICHYQIFK